MNYSSKILSQTLVQLCLAKGIDRIVISPGSRNAPLIIGFTSIPSFQNYSIVDERCAAFFALGMAQRLKKPVALVCTSGSALLNYYPAIAEAFYSDIPLIVISADRPRNLIDIGDGQTIRQENVFENHILYNANLVEGDSAQEKNELELNLALNCAIELGGPVHINIPFSEPLYDVVERASISPRDLEIKKSLRWEEPLNAFRELWNQHSRKMILIGSLAPNTIEPRWIEEWAKDKSILVFTESISNLHHDLFIPAIDQLITALDDDGFKKLQPDVLLTFGGMVVSKRIKAFLRNYPPVAHWHVGEHTANDTYFHLKHHFKTTPNRFLERFFPETQKTNSNYRDYWLEKKTYRLLRHDVFIKDVPFSDFSVYEAIFKGIPHGYTLHLANSAAVRYSQLFDQNPHLEVFCNRGTSGIDGSTSTAIGSAVAGRQPTVLVTGDLSFFYDSNALWNNYVPNNFKIIVVNNGGGGIFRILPKAKEVDHFEEYFETRHQLTAEQLCAMYGWNYASAKDQNSFSQILTSFFNTSEGPRLLEVFTPSEINDKVLKSYFKSIE
jgi:2-succinyl-5-enolpyruvyl-6-hydroxy-3-cyclohexene-1-carboxylate synthase